mgnify:CR=1 FL=1
MWKGRPNVEPNVESEQLPLKPLFPECQWEHCDQPVVFGYEHVVVMYEVERGEYSGRRTYLPNWEVECNHLPVALCEEHEKRWKDGDWRPRPAKGYE